MSTFSVAGLSVQLHLVLLSYLRVQMCEDSFSHVSFMAIWHGCVAAGSDLGQLLTSRCPMSVSKHVLPPDVAEDPSLYRRGGREKRQALKQGSKPGKLPRVVEELPPPVDDAEEYLYRLRSSESQALASSPAEPAVELPPACDDDSAVYSSYSRDVCQTRESLSPSISGEEEGCSAAQEELPPAVESLQVYFVYEQEDGSAGSADALMDVFSPPRLVPEATRQGLQASVSLDKTTWWDADVAEDRLELQRLLGSHRPGMLMMSPECRMFSILTRNCNLPKMDPLLVQIQMSQAVSHVDLCMELATQQCEAGRYFVLEHPAGASSWKLPSVQRVLQRADVFRVNFAQCRYGLTGPAGGPMRMLTSLMSNMPSIREEFRDKQCQCLRAGFKHERIKGSYKGQRRSRAAQVYPPGLVRALVSCCRAEMSRS